MFILVIICISLMMMLSILSCTYWLFLYSVKCMLIFCLLYSFSTYHHKFARWNEVYLLSQGLLPRVSQGCNQGVGQVCSLTWGPDLLPSTHDFGQKSSPCTCRTHCGFPQGQWESFATASRTSFKRFTWLCRAHSE